MIFVSRNLLSGAGDVKIPMLMGVTEVVCRVVFANVLSSHFGYQGIWWATGLTWLLTATVGCIRYASGKWKDKSLVTSA
jgi:Na+-driven multidrug efflux pump